MSQRKCDLIKGVGWEVSTTVADWVPSLRPLVKRLHGLTGPNDTLLRWRRAEYPSLAGIEKDPRWVNLDHPFGEEHRAIATRGLGVLAVSKVAPEFEEGAGRRPAIGRRLGSIVMVGVPLRGDPTFLSPVNEQGIPSPDGEQLGVVVTNGSGMGEAVLGTAALGGRGIWSAPTEHFVEARYAVVPQGLQRV